MRKEFRIEAWKVQCCRQGKRNEVINDFKKLKLRDLIQLVKYRKPEMIWCRRLKPCKVVVLEEAERRRRRRRRRGGGRS
jgi:hypothetical protein